MNSQLQRVTHIALLPFIYVKRLCGLVLSNLALSNRGRRMMLSVSLYAHLKEIDTDHLEDQLVSDLARDINELFKLVRVNEKALIIPILLHNRIWKDQELPNEDELRELPAKNNCKRILHCVPRWLRYDEKVMSDDIALIIRKHVGRRRIVK